MLEAVYVDTVEERAIVALKPKPAFRAPFQIATTREGSGVVLYKENPPDLLTSPEDDLVFLVETGEGRVFTICNQRWWSACLACIDSPRYILRLALGRRVKTRVMST